MPNTREKLVEIMADLDCNAEYCKDCEFGNDIDGCVRRQKEIIADRLIANGVTVHPCEVGQKIWLVFTPKYPANPNDKGRWFIQQDGVQRIIYGVKGVSIETWNMGTVPSKEIGKKLFFTREEAEAHLPQPLKGE